MRTSHMDNVPGYKLRKCTFLSFQDLLHQPNAPDPCGSRAVSPSTAATFHPLSRSDLFKRFGFCSWLIGNPEKKQGNPSCGPTPTYAQLPEIVAPNREVNPTHFA